MKKRNILIILLGLIFLLSACNFPSSAEPKSDPAAEVQTAAAETVNAQFTLNAQITPSATETSVPTDTPEASNTPEAAEDTATPTNVPADTAVGICDSILFVADVTIDDGTKFNAGDTFTKTWRLRNAGTCTWTTDYDLVFDSGDAMDGPASQALTAAVAPGDDIDISVDLTAPATEDTFRGNWQMRNASGAVFGLPGPFYVEIEVVAAAAAVSGSKTITLTSNDKGSVRSDATLNANPNTGDTDADVGSHAFLSFDISGIPASSTIEEVQVDFSDYDTLGDPFTSLGCLRAYQGSFFALDAGDYFVGAPLGAILRWCDTSELSSVFFDDDVKASIQSELGNSTYELRLQFNENETNSDGVADMARFGDVELEVTYIEP
jgi:hypothetical protein